MMQNKILGRCLCKSVIFNLPAQPISSGTCYCRSCQYISGGAPNYCNLYAKDDFEILEGKLVDYIEISDAGNEVTRQFCSTCGTHIASFSEQRVEFVSIKVGCLDDPSRFKPGLEIWKESAQPWHKISSRKSRLFILLKWLGLAQ